MTTNRRRFLHLCGVVGIGALAGCADDSETTTTVKSPSATLTPTMTPSQPSTEESATPSQTPTTPSFQTPTEEPISPSQQASIVPNDGDSHDGFGESVAVSSDGTTAIIGASDDEDPNGEDAGSAYVFESSGGTWTRQAKLTPDDGDSGDIFGGSVAVSSDGTTAIIGASNDEDPNGEDAGSAYVFESSGGTWTQQAKLTPDDGDSGDGFGTSVTVSSDGSTTLISASSYDNPNYEETTRTPSYDEDFGQRMGAVYVFESSGGSWDQQAILTAADGSRGDNFGSSVALSNDGATAVIGSMIPDTTGGAGTAYVFEVSGGSWSQQATLTHDYSSSIDNFGGSVAVSGDGTSALVGAVGADGGGAVYVFDRANRRWNEPTRLTANDAEESSSFGGAMAVSNDGATAIITDRYYGESVGSAYVFDDSGGSWTQQAKLAADDGGSYDDFGSSVAVSSDATTAIIGAREKDGANGTDSGSAYVFNL